MFLFLWERRLFPVKPSSSVARKNAFAIRLVLHQLTHLFFSESRLFSCSHLAFVRLLLGVNPHVGGQLVLGVERFQLARAVLEK